MYVLKNGNASRYGVVTRFGNASRFGNARSGNGPNESTFDFGVSSARSRSRFRNRKGVNVVVDEFRAGSVFTFHKINNRFWHSMKLIHDI